jgi:hypothetical protein
MLKPVYVTTTKSKRWATAVLTPALAFVLCGGPQMATAQQTSTAQPAQEQSSAASQTQAAPPADQQTTTAQPTSQQPSQNAPDQTQPASQSETAVQQQQQQGRPGMVDPSQGPLTPVPSTTPDQTPAVQPQDLPDAPSATQGQAPADQQTPAPRQNKPRTTQPVGVGTAQQAPTAGGAASKPAGAAIAPAKQKQYRSLLIKLGAIAGAGAALGTVYALSRGTKSTPPGAGR